MAALTRTCKKPCGLYQELLKSRWDVDRDLKSFVEDPLKFRGQLGRSDAFIFGDFAYPFFSRETWDTPRMDVLIEIGDKTDAFIQHLLQKEGYQITSQEDQSHQEPRDIAKVRRLTLDLRFNVC